MAREKKYLQAISSAPTFFSLFNQFNNSRHSVVSHINFVILFQHTVHSVSPILSGLVNNKPAQHFIAMISSQ